MGKGKRFRRRKKAGGKDLAQAFSEQLTVNFQKELRNS